ncbi:DUF3127 domain-containing protein [Aliifodinibius sp. S!AR15-10]|uniref:DUF3127 domain-containing protein n=1 Tax=Aliifodinibius sp. S!AR15-10 TaxID=2950437 RepID=UPI00286503E8|nr:DUF3127 domain-containing protein [Aliifodinibius sp. S!AR15-10]MDR8390876.1 DUF3127 domain-containing protein [Aliifodinibius sp. S!AR15-10]
MDVQIKGKVDQILEEQSGTGKNGPWRKQEFILETQDQYPKKVCITQWGEKIDEFDVQEGETLTAHVDIQSREYNGRWYTDVKAWKIERGQQGPQQGGPPEDVPFNDEEPTINMDDMDEDEIPF